MLISKSKRRLHEDIEGRGKRCRLQCAPNCPENAHARRIAAIARRVAAHMAEDEDEGGRNEAASDVDEHEENPRHKQPLIVDANAEEQNDTREHNRRVQRDVEKQRRRAH